VTRGRGTETALRAPREKQVPRRLWRFGMTLVFGFDLDSSVALCLCGENWFKI
jgi:hypothetical protein